MSELDDLEEIGALTQPSVRGNATRKQRKAGKNWILRGLENARPATNWQYQLRAVKQRQPPKGAR